MGGVREEGRWMDYLAVEGLGDAEASDRVSNQVMAQPANTAFVDDTNLNRLPCRSAMPWRNGL